MREPRLGENVGNFKPILKCYHLARYEAQGSEHFC